MPIRRVTGMRGTTKQISRPIVSVHAMTESVGSRAVVIEHPQGIYPVLTLTSMQAMNRVDQPDVFAKWLAQLVPIQVSQLLGNLAAERVRAVKEIEWIDRVADAVGREK